MPKEVIGYDLNGNKLSMSHEEVKAQAERIFEEGKLIAFLSEHDGDISFQVLGPPNLKTYYLLQDGLRAYKRILQERGLFQ